ncbi:MAG: insulinase family protein [Deltaproteobacteria bacterium]|nr:insulinase family protein [Deltaproteobacteria bacterium]
MTALPSGVITEVLPSGIKVLFEPLRDFSSVSVGIWVLTGSRDEHPAKAGISHFIEHLVFKGTPLRTAKEIALGIDSLGGSINAFTSKEYTSFFARILGESLGEAMDILGDITLNPLFQEIDLERERDVIIQEISMVEDTPDDFVHDLHVQEFWGGHELGRPILGTRQSLENMEREDIQAFHHERYRAGSIILTAAGAVDPHTMMEEANRVFGNISSGNYPLRRSAPVPTPHLRVWNRDSEQVHFCVGLEGIPVDDERRYSLFLLNTILGGGMSSRLFQKIREERGLAYSVYSYHSAFQDTGMLSVYCGTSAQNFITALDLIREEILTLAENHVPKRELAIAKRQVTGNMLLGLESTGNRMTQLARNEIYFQRQVTPAEIEERIQSVSPSEILEVAESLLKPGCRALTVIGPVREETLEGHWD